MQASKLQLDHYYLEELRFSLNENFGIEALENEVPLRAEDLEVTVEAGRNPDDHLQWFFKLEVRLDDVETKFPYDFTIRLGGLFDVSKDCPSNMVEDLATINAPSILYGAARELLAMTTARSRIISVFLPPVRFYGMRKEKAIEAELTEGIDSKKKVTTRKRTRRKVAAKKK